MKETMIIKQLQNIPEEQILIAKQNYQKVLQLLSQAKEGLDFSHD